MSKTLALSFSLSDNSMQTRGLRLMHESLPFHQLLNLKDLSIPLCTSNSPDGKVPESVEILDQYLHNSDNFVFAIPEAGGHYCAAFKNVVDWLIVKSNFNSQLGRGYSTSGKYTYVISFTPSVEGAGDRHFQMTQELLEKKLGAEVRFCHVFNRCWEHLLPGQHDFVSHLRRRIAEDCQTPKTFCEKVNTPSLSAYDVDVWKQQYERWNSQWTE
jgi:hypothetical protein